MQEVLHDKKYSPEYIKKNFSDLIQETEAMAYSKYKKAEDESWQKAIKSYLNTSMAADSNLEAVGSFLGSHEKDFDSFFLSIAQSRKSRAGKTFERIIRTLFKSLNYPFTEQPTIDGKPDFVMPNIDYYAKNAPDCIIFTAKRTIRERWRQIVTEGTRGMGFFLATIDENVSQNQLDDMRNNRIYLVVPKKIKTENITYKKSPTVIDFESFFEDYLDPAIKRWEKSGVKW